MQQTHITKLSGRITHESAYCIVSDEGEAHYSNRIDYTQRCRSQRLDAVTTGSSTDSHLTTSLSFTAGEYSGEGGCRPDGPAMMVSCQTLGLVFVVFSVIGERSGDGSKDLIDGPYICGRGWGGDILLRDGRGRSLMSEPTS